ncbi:eEF1A lysine and N-terminal methyltransferase-like [Acipenser ruthenus]|uniref:eEF1A lysine and N-terminal methyltransferase-like n=1 Tax=Acipenser ruthenus TaxID=7906 RepID=UPI00274133B4|nr:eEF1A lysine and N-terminal methyltransferase-like [Acipenser ruthenus]
MNLLPKSSKEFSSAEYWEKFFKKRGDKSFEWYGTYTELCGVLHRYIKPTDAVLVVGCGSSELSEQLYDAGYRALNRHQHDRPRPHAGAQLCAATRHGVPVRRRPAHGALQRRQLPGRAGQGHAGHPEVGRVLRVGGRYVCVTLAQEHVLRAAVDHFSGEGWAVRVHRVEGQEGGFCLPVFVLVCTKFRWPAEGGAALPQILEVCEGGAVFIVPQGRETNWLFGNV